jgi:hypothetical protein
VNEIERYVAELEPLLRVGARYRKRILAEVRDHLVEAAEVAGRPDGAASGRDAVQAFGVPAVLADGFNAEAALRSWLRMPLVMAGGCAAVAAGMVIAGSTGSGRTVSAPLSAQIVFFAALLLSQVAVVGVGRGVSLTLAQRGRVSVAGHDMAIVRRSVRVSAAALMLATVLWVTSVLLANQRGALSSAAMVVVAIGVMSAGAGAPVAWVLRWSMLWSGSPDDAEPATSSAGSSVGVAGWQVGERLVGIASRHPVMACALAALGGAVFAALRSETGLPPSLPWAGIEAVVVVAAFFWVGPMLGLRGIHTRPQRPALP